MAKENAVMLHGIVVGGPYPVLNPDRSIKKIMLFVKVIERRRSTASGDEDIVNYATPMIYSGNPAVIEEIRGVKQGDLVDVFGSLSTATVPKVRKCPVCGAVSRAQGGINYIAPLYFCRRETGLSEEKANELLLKRAEISNRITVIGNVCAGLNYYDNDGQEIPQFQYQIAIPRTIRMKGDVKMNAADERVDYPWVHVYGDDAAECRDVLRIGSVVYLKGHLRTNEVTKRVICDSCAAEYTASDYPYTEIAPSFTEYIYNCNFPEGKEPDEGASAGTEGQN